MSTMFYGCSSLISLPNISNWKISSLHNNENPLFFWYNNPSALKSFIDILKLEVSNDYNIYHIFNESFNILNIISP